MELDQTIQNELIQLNINPQSLSENEKKYIKQIFEAYMEFEATQKGLVERIAQNKLNKSVISNKVDCSRQALYKNPTLMIYINHCIEKANKLAAPLATDVVSKEKFNQLKKENEQILLNVVDNALKDAEILRLVKEVKEKNNRIDNLLARIEDLNKEVSYLKKKTYS